MKIKFYLLTYLVLALSVQSCRKDDGLVDTIPERDRVEQQVEDDGLLMEYLDTHYYNSVELSGIMNPTIDDIVITELLEGETLPVDHTMLIDDIESRMTSFSDVDYDYYILRINQGGGTEQPNFAGNIRLNYSGNTMDGEVFDSSANPVVFDLTSLIPGWGRVLPEFNVAELPAITNPDGTVTYNNAGVGVMFLPSGLAFWSSGAPGIGVYVNVAFKFELFETEDNDHDSDNIPSHLEDLDGDLFLNDEDTDEDGLVNFVDVDDDGDGVLTRYEDLEPDQDLLVDEDEDGDPTNDIGDGDPTNDDTDGDGVPNYLDTDDTCSNQDDENENGVPDCDE
jgi:hypothetical protein